MHYHSQRDLYEDLDGGRGAERIQRTKEANVSESEKHERHLALWLIGNVERNIDKWRSWFPSERSEVEVSREQLLALCSYAKRHIAEHPADEPPAVFSEDTCFLLNANQHNRSFHPYTCGNCSRHRPLIATRHGWKCADCDYTQDWAHEPISLEHQRASFNQVMRQTDGHEPITADWLHTTSMEYCDIERKFIALDGDGHSLTYEAHGVMGWCFNGCSLHKQPRTRWELRRLADALGFDIKEGKA